jgi:hypothetical protein
MGLNRNLGQLTEVITEGGGNIGIGGTPNAGFRVDVNGTGRFSSTVQASAFRLTGMTAGSGALYWSSDRVTLANYNPTGVVMIEANGGAAVATFGGTTFNNDFVGTGRFSGNVAINGSSLDINPSSGNPNITLRTGNTFRGYIEGNSNGLSFGAGASANIYFTLANSGAATFSSSVTVDRMAIAGTVEANARLVIGTDSSTTNVGSIRLRGHDVYEGNIYKTADYGIYMDTDSNLRPIRIDGSAFITGITGNVGIGTTSPVTLLHLERSNPLRGIIATIKNSATSGHTGSQIHFVQDSIADWVIGQPAGTNAFAFWNNRFPSGDGTERMRITSGGNVGIGTANATGQSSDNRVLQIYGAGFANRAQIHFVNANTGEGTSDGTFIGIDSNKEFFINNTEGATIFENSGSERMRIFSSGNVFIGPSPSDNGNRLRVNGTTNSSQFNSMSGTVNAAPSTNTTFFTPTSTGLYLARIYLGGSPSQTWNAVIIFDFDATNILVVNQTNSINVSTVVSGTNIQVRQVGGITYTFTYQVLKIA